MQEGNLKDVGESPFSEVVPIPHSGLLPSPALP